MTDNGLGIKALGAQGLPLVGQAGGIKLGAGSQAVGDQESAKQAKLASGAHEFEAMLLNEMLKPLKFGQAEAVEDGAEGTGGAAGDVVRGFATEAMAKAIAEKGGFGLADQIIRQVTAEETKRTGTEGRKEGKDGPPGPRMGRVGALRVAQAGKVGY